VLSRRKGTTLLLCYLEGIPPFSFKQIVVTPSDVKPAIPTPWKMTNHVVETPLYRIRFDSKGQLSSLHDKALRRELIAKGGRANQFQAFKDLPKQWDAWDIDPEYPHRHIDLLHFERLRIVEQGPLRATVRLEFRTEGGSKIAQDMLLYHNSRRIDFKTAVTWRETQTLLKVAFPLNVKTRSATYEIQFGALQRTTRPSDPRDKAKYEVPAQQWADLSEQKFGVSLLNDSKYGHDASDTTLRLTLLRSPHYPHAIDPLRMTDDRVTDQGEHQYTYSLFPHAGDWRNGGSVQRARELNQPAVVTPGNAVSVSSLFTISSPNVIVDSVKKAEDSDDVIIRLHEAYGQSLKTTLTLGLRAEAAVECDLLEQDLTPLKIGKMKVSLKFSAFEIKTLKVKFKAKK